MRKLLLFAVGGVLGFGLLSAALFTASWAEEDIGKCPISGKPAKKESVLNVNGKSVYFCCNNCPTAYKKKYLVKDDGAKSCPISGKAAKAESSLIHMEGEKVAFCCNNCPKKFATDKGFEFKDKGPTTCPVSGKEAKADHKLVVNGESIYFCCNNCPKKYISDLNVKDGEPEKCAVAGRPIKEGTEMILVTSKTVYFCCDNCPKAYAAKNIKGKGAEKKKDKKEKEAAPQGE